MSTLRPLRNGIIFQFEENIIKNKKFTFEEKTDWGFKLNSFDESSKHPRWGIVVTVGNEVVDEGLVTGARILIEALKWTNGVEVEGETYWKTDEDHVLATDEAA